MRRWAVAAAFVAAAGLMPQFATSAAAQQQDVRDMIDRIDRLERDLNILQSQFYRSQAGSQPASGGTTVIASPAAGGGGMANDAYSSLDQRISALEEQIRNLTGQIERADHDAKDVGTKLDRIQADNEVRFKEIEQKVQAAPAPVAAGAAPAAPAAPAGDQAAAGQGQTDWNPTMGSAPHPLGQIHESSAARPDQKTAAVANTPPAAAAAAKTPQEQYDAAFTMLRNNDNDGAAKAFQAFVTDHAKDPLAGNATFWLGQIAFAQGKYEQAAPIFFDAYSKYPKSAKAGESLLKVGLSMSNLNKKKEACAALIRFSTEFPDASDSLKRQAGAEKQKLGCG